MIASANGPDTVEPAHGWRADALCAQTDPNLFYPEGPQSSRAARAVCAICPVTDECLAYALNRPEPHGVWGGLTARDRTMLRRRQDSG
ncbi:WhiB family transcriptional regulator [Streptomyces sp. NPDC058644]|uniref:WhiB family transcriptional regulator n=1 Tax=unclassified Streptomyces TaxID=2593676 RepID=UPI003669567C